MAVSDTDVKAIYQGNGSTTAFAIPFALQPGDISHIKVYLRDETDTDNITESLRTITTHYTLNSATSPTTVTMLVAPSSTQKLIVIRESPLTQQVSYNNNSAFLATDHEKALDRLAYQIQCLDEAIDRSIKVALGDPTSFDATLPPSTTANKADRGLYVNEDGDGLTYGPTAQEIFDAQAAAEAAAAAAQASELAAGNSEDAAAASAVQAAASESAAGASAIAAAASEVAAELAETNAETAEAAAEAAQAAAEAALASMLPNITGTWGAPQTYANGSTIATGNFRRHLVFAAPTGADHTTGVAIAAGSVIGDILDVILVGNGTNVFMIDDGAGPGTNQNGAFSGINNMSISYIWTGSAWYEVARRG